MISEVILLNTSYYMRFIFVFKEIYEFYKWLLEYIKDFYEYLDISDPIVILTDTKNNLI